MGRDPAMKYQPAQKDWLWCDDKRKGKWITLDMCPNSCSERKMAMCKIINPRFVFKSYG